MRPSLLLTFMLVGCGDMGLAAIPDEPVVAGQDPAQDEAASSSDDAADEASDLDVAELLYAVAPDDIRVVEPAGLDGLKDEFLNRDLLVFVADEDEAEISLDVALADDSGQQNPCERVLSLPEGAWTEPSFDVGPGELTTTFAGGNPATFQSLRMQGTFAEDGDSWTGKLSAVLDARELAPALPDMGDICELVDALGGTCSACDDGAPQCFALRFEDLHGERVSRAFDPTPTCD